MSFKRIEGEDIIGKNIFLIPVERSSPQGKDRSMIEIGNRARPRRANRPAEAQYPLSFEIDHTIKMVRSGMDGMITNPYSDASELPVRWKEHASEVLDKKELTVQEYMEILNNVPKGTYNPISTVYSMAEVQADRKKLVESKNTALTSFTYYLDFNNITPLSWANPKDRLAIFAAYMSQKIANSKAEVSPSHHEFYIANESDTLDKKQEIRRTKTQAVSLLSKVLESNVFVQYQFAVLLKIGRGEMTQMQIDDELSSYVWSDKKINDLSSRERIRNFMELYEYYQTKPDKFYIDYLVEQAKNTGVFRLSNNKFYWISQRDSNEALYDLGYNLDKFKSKLKEEKELLTAETEDDNIYHMLLTDLDKKQTRLG